MLPRSTSPAASSLVHSLTPTRPHRTLHGPRGAAGGTAAASVNPGDGAWVLHTPAHAHDECVALSPASAAAVASTKRHQHRPVYGASVADPAAGSLFDVDAPALPVLPLRTTTHTTRTRTTGSSTSSSSTTTTPRPELHTH